MCFVMAFGRCLPHCSCIPRLTFYCHFYRCCILRYSYFVTPFLFHLYNFIVTNWLTRFIKRFHSLLKSLSSTALEFTFDLWTLQHPFKQNLLRVLLVKRVCSNVIISLPFRSTQRPIAWKRKMICHLSYPPLCTVQSELLVFFVFAYFHRAHCCAGRLNLSGFCFSRVWTVMCKNKHRDKQHLAARAPKSEKLNCHTTL